MHFRNTSDYNYLFSKTSVFDAIGALKNNAKEAIATYDSNKLLNTPEADLVNYLVETYKINVPILENEEISVAERETEIDVSHDIRRGGYGRGPMHVTGTEIEVIVPFDGDARIFNVQPSSYSLSPPIADVKNNTLVFKITEEKPQAELIKKKIEETTSQIQHNLNVLQNDFQSFNDSLTEMIKNEVSARRNKLLANQNMVASLGYKLKTREDANLTYAAPKVQRRITPKMPTASTAPYKPEPELKVDDYDHILKVIGDLAVVMERSPSAFKTMDEETLRTHILVQLNGHYQGNATGETFNYEGKTDILIRENNRNIFIAECKFWRGQKTLKDTIDQLLKYTCWRDTKTAIILFNQNKDFTNVLETVIPTVENHSNFKKFISKTGETSYRFILKQKDDAARELILTVLAFNIPH